MRSFNKTHNHSTRWAQVNPVLEAGKVGLETDTAKYKIGNGTSHWNDLPYSINEDAVQQLVSDSTGEPSEGGGVTLGTIGWPPGGYTYGYFEAENVGSTYLWDLQQGEGNTDYLGVFGEDPLFECQGGKLVMLKSGLFVVDISLGLSATGTDGYAAANVINVGNGQSVTRFELKMDDIAEHANWSNRQADGAVFGDYYHSSPLPLRGSSAVVEPLREGDEFEFYAGWNPTVGGGLCSFMWIELDIKPLIIT